MKLEEGKRYPAGFVGALVLWALLTIIGSQFAVPDPASLGFAILVVFLVAYQLYSGVCLDRTWVASVSREKEPRWFWGLLLGQMGLAAFAAYFAFNR